MLKLRTVIYITVALLVLIGIGLHYLCRVYVDTEFKALLSQYSIPNIFDGIDGYVGSNLKDVSTVYGEVHTVGMKKVYALASRHNIHTFLDLGCGIGKGVVIAKLLGFKTSYGVELVDTRVRDAVKATLKLPIKIRKDIHISQGNILDFDIGQFKAPLCIFISNLLFSSELTRSIFHKIVKEAPDGTIVVSSANDIDKIDVPYLTPLGSMVTPMSWSYDTLSFVFRVDKTGYIN